MLVEAIWNQIWVKLGISEGMSECLQRDQIFWFDLIFLKQYLYEFKVFSAGKKMTLEYMDVDGTVLIKSSRRCNFVTFQNILILYIMSMNFLKAEGVLQMPRIVDSLIRKLVQIKVIIMDVIAYSFTNT